MYKNYTTADFTYEDLDKLQAVDIEEYKEYLKLYQHKKNIMAKWILPTVNAA